MHCPEGPAELMGLGRPEGFFPQPHTPSLMDRMGKIEPNLVTQRISPWPIVKTGEVLLYFEKLVVKLSHKRLVAYPSYLLGPCNARPSKIKE